MRRDRTRRAALALVLALGLALTGCAGSGPPAIRAGAPCTGCGMSITDLGFACERQVAGGWKQYDSIECLLRDPDGHAYLADYDTRTLHDADSMWVVRGSFPSPMGGGYAAFLTRRAADDIAARTGGRVDRLEGFASAGERAMKRYGFVLAGALVLALALGVVARLPRHATGPSAGDAAPLPTVALRVEFAGSTAHPEVASVPANHRVQLSLVNAGPRAIAPTLAGYEDQVAPGTIAPGATWSGEFVSDRPGEAFAWLVDGEPQGRLSVSGSHLVEGHR